MWSGVPDFGVAHETFAQADCNAMCRESAVAVILGDGIHIGCVCCLDSVSFETWRSGDAPAIVYAVG
jgi:hypothetical protein